jgi:RNA polymerase sigma-70 factor (TIGR02954 family)
VSWILEVMKLMKKAQKGDDHAFYELMQIHKVRLLKIAFTYLRNEDDALEALQEVTFRAYKSIHKVKHSEYLSTWLIRIMLNYCFDECQKRKKVTFTDQFENIVVKENIGQSLEIQEALNNIDLRLREVIILKYFHDLKIKDIAQILDSPESTIKTWLYKGLKALQGQLEERVN